LSVTYEQVLKHFRTQEGIAAALGLTQPSISLWKQIVPAHYQYQLEIITAGALRVDEALRAPRNIEPEQHA